MGAQFSGAIADLLSPYRPPTPVSRLNYPAVAAHRGGKAVHPENTLAAFRAVTAAHPEAVLEMDVRGLADGTLVLCHDETVDRVSANGLTGRVDQMSVADWSGLRIINPSGDPVPATFLTDVLAEYAFTDRVLMIELKDSRARNKFIEAVWPHRGRVIACSFDEQVVRIFAGSGLNAQQLSGAVPTSYAPGLNCVGIRGESITAQMCDQAHAAGVKVWAWSADGTENDLLAMGVDGLILNSL